DAALARPKEAQRLAEAALEASGDHLAVVLQQAGWLLLTGNRDAYRRLCLRSLERFDHTDDPRTPYLVARMCGLDVDPPAEVERLLRVARAVNTEVGPWRLHTVGLIEYRAGRVGEAIQHFRQSLEAPWPGHSVSWLGLALALHRAGQRDEARTWLEKA